MGRRKISQVTINQQFKLVLEGIERGLTIKQAIENIGLWKENFYKRLSPEQKKEMKVLKMAKAISDKFTNSTSDYIIHEFQ